MLFDIGFSITLFKRFVHPFVKCIQCFMPEVKGGKKVDFYYVHHFSVDEPQYYKDYHNLFLSMLKHNTVCTSDKLLIKLD